MDEGELEEFGPRKPPLCVTIKGFLDKYPDGQIFKEVIQNADDALATKVEFILDHRTEGITDISSKIVPDRSRSILQHSFQGPALLAYNNAVFCDKDWRNIQTLQESGKAEDPLKVGKFGIGFNSVYHITDLPMIISGKYCGFFDPQERIWEIQGHPQTGRKFELTRLHRSSSILDCLGEVFGSHSMEKNFNGTVFRFPLRKSPSKLSGNCYSPQQIQALIDTLREEAKYLLLFLQSVRQIGLTHLYNKKHEKLIFKVSISDADLIKRHVTIHEPHSVVQSVEPRGFIEAIHTVFEPGSCYSVSKVVSSGGSFDVVVTDETGEYLYKWLVVQQVGSTEQQVREKAKRQHALPWVGTAVEVKLIASGSGPSGRLFCFLPMPYEATAPIPVIVNGTFALSDNRRALKWPAAERKNDPQAEWNKMLVERCLPSCYVKLVLLLREVKINTDVYKAWPNPDELRKAVHVTRQDWSGILAPFFKELFTHKVIYSTSRHKSSCWCKISDDDVLFDDGAPAIVVDTLLHCQFKVAKMVPVLQSAIQYLGMSVNVISPKLFRDILKKNTSAYQMSDKLELLMYCLQDGNYADLLGLELLPLVSGEFIKFSKRGLGVKHRYLCSANFPQTILRHCFNFLVFSDNTYLQQHLQKLAQCCCTQVKLLQAEDVAYLLNQFIPKSGNRDDAWLKVFWKWLEPQNLHLFKDLPVVPVGERSVAKLTKSAGVIFVPFSQEVSKFLHASLTKYHLQLAYQTNSTYLKQSVELMKYVYQFDGPSVLDAISSVTSRYFTLDSISLTFDEASALQEFLFISHREIQHKHKTEILYKLAIFHTLQNPRHPLCSIRIVTESNQTMRKAIAEYDSYDFVSEFLPNKPLVISRAHNRRYLLEVMEDSVKFMNKMEFLCEILLPISNSLCPTALERLMIKVLTNFENLIETYPFHKQKFIKILENLPFLKIHSGSLKCPKELYDPSKRELRDLFEGKDVFPVNHTAYVQSLKKCGLRGLESVTGQCVVSIIQEIGKSGSSSEPVKCDRISYRRAKAVVYYLYHHQCKLQSQVTVINKGVKQLYSLRDALSILTRTYSWLPVHSDQPSPSCLKWKGCQYTQHLASSHIPIVVLDTEYQNSNLPLIMGSEVVFIDGCLPLELANILSSSKLSQVKAVIGHLILLVREFNDHFSQSRFSTVKSICMAAYQFLDNACKKCNLPRSPYTPLFSPPTSMLSSEEAKSILSVISGCCDQAFIFTGKEFVKPLQVARCGGFAGPYLYSLPGYLHPMEYLTKVLQVKDKFEAVDLTGTLNKIHERYGSRSLPVNCLEVVREIVSLLGKCNLEEMNEDTYLPDESYRLQQASKLSIKESWCASADNCLFVCEDLPRPVAIKLGVKSVCNQLLQQYTSSNQHFQGTSFGQKEDLTRRIKNILSQYPLDRENPTFLKELMQNADDAKATKMCVILDKRTHGTKHVLSENWPDLQGPALLVWNNAEFSEEDMTGIQQLGLGSKRNDPGSIGQFGIGFNVVYHITDCPSFITGGRTLCIFDPHCRYAPGATPFDPGRRYDNIDEAFWSKFSSLKSAYLRDFCNEFQTGSLFRFPLRYTQELLKSSHLVEHPYGGEVMSLVDADEMKHNLDVWVPLVKESLLFLNHLTQFSCFVISEDGTKIPKQEYNVYIDDSDRLNRDRFHDDCKNFFSTMKSKLITYCLSITSDSGGQRCAEKWLVQQGVGDIDNQVTCNMWRFKHISPRHGVAALISPSNPTTFKGKAFCFLPLPVNTNLPVHVNGQFALSNNRRSLWTTNEQDGRKLWNDNLIKAISSSYARFLVIARQHFVDTLECKDSAQLRTALSRYYKLFPYWESHDELQKSYKGRAVLTAKRSLSRNPENEWRVLGQETFKKLWLNNAQILVFCYSDRYGTIDNRIKWCVLYDKVEPYCQAYFVPPLLSDASMKQLLVKIGMTITCAPASLREHFEKLRCKLFVCKTKEVYAFYTQFHRQILSKCCPIPISDTPFQTPDEMVKFTSYITVPSGDHCQFRKYYGSPFGQPLLLTADGYIRLYDQNSKVINSCYSNLFPKSLSKFLHPSMVKLKDSLLSLYFSAQEPYEVISNLLMKSVSPMLVDVEEVDNANGQIISWYTVESLWKCLCFDFVFKQHQQEIVSHFAIIPTFNQYLFSTKSSVIPLVPPNSLHNDYSDVFSLLKSFGLPFYDFRVPVDVSCSFDVKEVIKQHCVEMSQTSEVLKILYHFHIRTGVLAELGDEIHRVSDTLLKYFGSIHFARDKECSRYIKSLPLFKAVSGSYTSIWNKAVYKCPRDYCKAGYDKWAVTETVVFLDSSGEWKSLHLWVDPLGLLDLYTKFIFQAFEKFDTEERRAHLLYIRDTLTTNMLLADQQQMFEDLKLIPCLEDPNGSGVLSITHFSDPRVSVFQMFSENFKFPNEEYRSECWMSFFENAGLKTRLKAKEFVKFCETVAHGQHSKSQEASDCLLEYLFSEKALDWHTDLPLLQKIGSICFVKPNPLPALSWIKAPCSPVNAVLQFTTLRGAAVCSCAKRVWTVMPVVSTPPLCGWGSLTPRHTVNKFKQNLGMVIEPSSQNIYKNVLSISQSGLADFHLFNTYKERYIIDSVSERTNLVDTMLSNIDGLCKCEGSSELKNLATVACIPVSADGSTHTSKAVLVNSLQVVQSMHQSEECLKPYINELPTSMFKVSEALEIIGMTPRIQVKHLEYMLKTIHNQLGSNRIQINQMQKVRTAIIKLVHLCAENPQQAKMLKELYLPCHRGTLVKSTNLLLDDLCRYSELFDLNFSSTSYSVFILPADSSTHAETKYSQPGSPGKISEAFVCSALPKRLRPIQLAVCVEEMIVEDSKVVEKKDLCCQIAQMTQFHELIQEALPPVLAKEDLGTIEQREQFANVIGSILKTMKVQAILNLQAKLYLTLLSPPFVLGTRDVPFIFSKEQNASYLLYVDSMESASSSMRFWRQLSQCLCIQAAKINVNDPTDFLLFSKILGEFLQIKSVDDLREVTHDLSVTLDIVTPFQVPVLGGEIPICDCYQDINNIYRPQEWVAYEVREGRYICAIVLCPMVADGEENLALIERKYSIRFGENEDDTIDISALYLYKLIDHHVHEEETTVNYGNGTSLERKCNNDSLVSLHANSSSSASTTKRKLTKSQKLKELRKKICRDLKTVWNLSKENRKRALKRLYLHYHPDKAEPEEADVYDDAFKFLQTQIERLHNGLDMENPEDESSHTGSRDQSDWSDFYESWDKTANNMHRGQRQRKRRGKGFGEHQPKPDNVEAERWLKQAQAEYSSMKELRHIVPTKAELASTICFLAHQVVEKALKAGMYWLLGLDPACLQHHELYWHAAAIHSERPSDETKRLSTIASLLEKHYVKSRYPNTHSRPKAPVDVYTVEQAYQFADHAEEALLTIQRLM